MHITQVQFFAVQMPLKIPYTIAYETIDSTTNILVHIQTNNGLSGFGCAAPDFEVTKETPQSVIDTFEQTIVPEIIEQDPLRRVWLLNNIKEKVSGQPSALAAIDMALYDLLGKVTGLPLYKILGAYRTSIPTSITVGIMPTQETVAQVQDFIKQGFTCIKVKGGQCANTDIERMFKVREAVGSNIELRFDANQGYSVDDTLLFVSKTSELNIELLEQPTPKKHPKMLGQVTQKAEIPIMADESIMSLRDVFRLARNDMVDMVNIKLMKVGGIAEALMINSVAQAASLEVMVGCMDEAQIGISAGLHFALSRRNVLYADLDGHLDLIDDPTIGCFTIKDGVMFPNDKPGLGLQAIL